MYRTSWLPIVLCYSVEHEEIFLPNFCLYSSSCRVSNGLLFRGKAAEAWRWTPTRIWCQSWVDLYLCFLSGPSRPVPGRILPLHLHLFLSTFCSNYILIIFIVVYIFLLLSMYSYCSSMYSYRYLCILIVIYVFLDSVTLTEIFPCFFLGCKANARV